MPNIGVLSLCAQANVDRNFKVGEKKGVKLKTNIEFSCARQIFLSLRNNFKIAVFADVATQHTKSRTNVADDDDNNIFII